MATLPGLDKGVFKDPAPPAVDSQISPITIPDGTTLVTTKTTNETIDNVNQLIDYISGDAGPNFIPQAAIDTLVSDLSARELLVNKVTTIATPGNDTNYGTEKAVRDALDLKEDSLGFTPEDSANKGAVSGYAALDASQELLLANFPSGAALQVLRRNAANDALEFADSAAAGITSINGDTTAAQIIAAGTGLVIVDAGATHTLSIDSTVVTLTGVQTLTNKILITPTIASFTNAIHDHEDAEGGGVLAAAAIGDFEMEVTGNSAVVLNTAKVTNATHTGDVTGDTILTIADDAVTYAKMQNVVADDVLLGNIAGAGGIVTELTGTQVNTILPVFTDTLNGLVPLSGGGATLFLNAEGDWVVPAGGSGGQVDSVVGTTNRISVDSADPVNPIVDIDSAYVGQTSITTLGTITTGVWNGTDIDGANIDAELVDLSDVTAKTGTGTVVVMNISPTIVTPTIASFANANHDHEDAAGGGQLLSTTALSDTANIAYLNTDNTFLTDTRQTFTHQASKAGIALAAVAGDVTTPNDGEFWYNLTTNKFRARENGVTIDMIGGTGGSGTLRLVKLEGATISTDREGLNFADTTTINFTVTDDVGNNEADVIAAIVNSSVVDAQIGTHTSTKITITAKGQLNSGIVYNDQANIFGDFIQTFKDNSITIESPDGLTPTTLVNAQQTLARNLTIPILTADRDIVVTGEASQISLGTEVTGAITDLSDVTAKTGTGTTVVFDTSPTIVTPTIVSFVNATHNHQAAAGGGTLLSTSALSDTDDIAYLNTANTYSGAGDQDFASSALRNVDFVESNATTPADAGFIRGGNADDAIAWRNAAGTNNVDIIVSAADVFLFRINGTTELSQSAGELNIQNNNLVVGSGIIEFRTANASIRESSFNGLEIDVAPGESIFLRVGDVIEYEASPTAFILDTNILQFIDVDTSIVQSGSDLQYDVATGGTHDLRINNSLEYEFSASQANFFGNSLVNAPHDHEDAAGGGVLGKTAIPSVTVYEDEANTWGEFDQNIATGGKWQEGGVNISPIGIHDIGLPATAYFLPTFEPATGLVNLNFATNEIDKKVFEFTSTTADERIQTTIYLPRNWDEGNVDIEINWSFSSGTGVVRWAARIGATGDGEAIDNAFASATFVNDTAGIVGELQKVLLTVAVPAGIAPGDEIQIEIFREGSNAADTFTGTARLHGTVLRITTDEATAA